MTTETRIDIYDKKYTLIHNNGANFRCLRHGEPWRDLVGDKMVLALVQEVEELRHARDELSKAVLHFKQGKLNSHSNQADQRAQFEAACYAYYLERHAAGKTEDRNEPVGTPEQMFWKQENGTYGVLMYNASWWAWQAAHAAKTPSSQWHANGEIDPHAGHYDKERASLCMGKLTDDELANGAFMNYDQRLSVADMINPKPGQHMPIIWMTAVKDRIRWLSRSLEKALAASASSASAMQEAPMSEITMILNEVMEIAVKNGANSVSMPDEYVAVAHFLSYPHLYVLPYQQKASDGGKQE